MQKRTIFLFTLLLTMGYLTLSSAADEKPPVFVFGGKQLYVGMAKNQAVEVLYPRAANCRRRQNPKTTSGLVPRTQGTSFSQGEPESNLCWVQSISMPTK